MYFPSAETVKFGDEVTVDEQVLYKDRYGSDFGNTIREFATASYPDLTSASSSDYDLPGGREEGAHRRHDYEDDSPERADEDTIGPVEQEPVAPHATLHAS